MVLGKMSSKFGGWVRGKFVSPAFFATRVGVRLVASASRSRATLLFLAPQRCGQLIPCLWPLLSGRMVVTDKGITVIENKCFVVVAM